MIHASAEKYHFDAMFLRLQLRKPMREQNAFHVTYVPSTSRLYPMEEIYSKAFMSVLDNIETAYRQDIHALLCFHSIFSMMYGH